MLAFQPTHYPHKKAFSNRTTGVVFGRLLPLGSSWQIRCCSRLQSSSRCSCQWQGFGSLFGGAYISWTGKVITFQIYVDLPNDWACQDCNPLTGSDTLFLHVESWKEGGGRGKTPFSACSVAVKIGDWCWCQTSGISGWDGPEQVVSTQGETWRFN